MKPVSPRLTLSIAVVVALIAGASAVAVALQPEAVTVDTASFGPPASNDSLGRLVGEPSEDTSEAFPEGVVPDEDALPPSPPALAFADPLADDSQSARSPSLGESASAETSASSASALPWDDSAAPAATTTSNPLRSPAASSPSAAAPSATAPSTTAQLSTSRTSTSRSPSSSSPATTRAPSFDRLVTTVAPPQAPARKSIPTTAAPTTTALPATTTTTTAPANSTSTAAPAPRPVGTKGVAGYIAPSAPTYIPVYDTAWQMMVRSTPGQADNYFAALKANGFSGTWSGIIHHAPATYNLNFAGGGQVGSMQNGNVVLSDAYVTHARKILDAAQRHGMKVGLVAAWQNLYLPGGGADNGVGSSSAVRGTITTANAYAYGRHIADKFGDHPAVSMWVFGGDAGTNNTEANKAVWREMARGVRDAGNGLSITYHTPTSEFNQLNYAGEPWLDFIAPETGHAQHASATESELRSVKSAYRLPVWQGEPRYFNINFDWVDAAFRNPGVNEVRADAQAAENAGVSGYVYGDAGRWTWCAGYGDSSPCNANNVAGSFGAGEQAVIEVFSN